MAEIFFGEWTVTVDQLNADFLQRFIIAGSDSSDGTYSGIPGVNVTVSGPKWNIELQWSNRTSGWHSSNVRKVMACTVEEGLSTTLYADDGLGDGDYNDIILVCRSLDPILNPMLPYSNPYSFTITEDMLYEPTAIDETEEPIKHNIFLPLVSK